MTVLSIRDGLLSDEDIGLKAPAKSQGLLSDEDIGLSPVGAQRYLPDAGADLTPKNSLGYVGNTIAWSLGQALKIPSIGPALRVLGDTLVPIWEFEADLPGYARKVPVLGGIVRSLETTGAGIAGAIETGADIVGWDMNIAGARKLSASIHKKLEDFAKAEATEDIAWYDKLTKEAVDLGTMILLFIENPVAAYAMVGGSAYHAARAADAPIITSLAAAGASAYVTRLSFGLAKYTGGIARYFLGHSGTRLITRVAQTLGVEASVFATMSIFSQAANNVVAMTFYDKNRGFLDGLLDAGKAAGVDAVLITAMRMLFSRGRTPAQKIQTWQDSIVKTAESEGILAPTLADRAVAIGKTPEAKAFHAKVQEVGARSGMLMEAYARTLRPVVDQMAALYELRNKLNLGEAFKSRMFIDIVERIGVPAREPRVAAPAVKAKSAAVRPAKKGAAEAAGQAITPQEVPGAKPPVRPGEPPGMPAAKPAPSEGRTEELAQSPTRGAITDLKRRLEERLPEQVSRALLEHPAGHGRPMGWLLEAARLVTHKGKKFHELESVKAYEAEMRKAEAAAYVKPPDTIHGTSEEIRARINAYEARKPATIDKRFLRAIVREIEAEELFQEGHHGTVHPEKIGRFSPLSHFGSANAANRVISYDKEGKKLSKITAVSSPTTLGERVIPVELDIKNPLRLEDKGYGRWTASYIADQANERGVLSDAMLKVIRGIEKSDSAKLPSRGRLSPAADAMLIQALEARGYDGIVYRNTVEDVGSDSYMNFRPEQVKSTITGGTKFEQPAKARVIFTEDERGIISRMQFSKTADLGSVLHELFHVWRRQVMTKSESDALLKALGESSWDRTEFRNNKDVKVVEEKAARLFERWVREGKAEGPLAPVLQSLGNYMSQIYKRAEDVPYASGLNPEIKSFFQEFLSPDTYKRSAGKPELTKNAALSQDPDTFYYRPSVVRRVITATRSLVDLTAGLKKYPAGREHVRKIINVDTNRKLLSSKLELKSGPTIKALTSADYKWLADGTDNISNYTRAVEYGMKAPNPRIQAAVDLTIEVNNVLGLYFELAGGYRKGRGGVVSPFTTSESPRRPRFMTDDFFDAIVAPNSPRYKTLFDWIKSQPENAGINDFELKTYLRSTSEGLQHGQVGMLEHIRKIPKMPDFLVTDGKRWEVMNNDPSRLIPESIEKQALKIAWTQEYGQGMLETPSITSLRSIANALRVLPKADAESLRAKLVMAGIEDSVLEGLNFRSLSVIARELKIHITPSSEQILEAINKVETLRNLPPRQVVRLGHAIKNLKGIPRDLTEPIEANPRSYKTSSGATATILPATAGEEFSIPGTPYKGKAAWSVHISDGQTISFSTKAEALKYIRSNLGGRKIRQAKLSDVGRFRDPDALLTEIKRRSNEVLRDDLTRLYKEFKAEGGRPQDFELFSALAQGLPYPGYRYMHHPFARMLTTTSTAIGTTQISTATIPNIFQTLLLPGYTGSGKHFIEAYKLVSKDPKGELLKSIAIGAARHPVVDPQLATNISMAKLVNALAHKSARITLFQGVNTADRVVAATYFRLWADDWRANGMSFKDTLVAEDLGLSKSEINSIQNRKMSDFTYAKIIQRGVARTQYDTEARALSGRLTENPVLKHIFSYQYFNSGQLRVTLKMFDDLGRGIKLLRADKDPKLFLVASQRFLTMLAVAAGTGMVQNSVRDAILRGAPSDDDETILSKALQGLAEVQVLGPATRMLIASGAPNSSIDSAAISLSPKLKAAIDVIGLGYNLLISPFSGSSYGRQGRLPIKTQATSVVKRHFGAYRAASRWYDHFAWPDEDLWREGRRLSSQHMRTISPGTEVTDAKINPEYYLIRRAVERMDIDSARSESAAYYRSHGINNRTIANLRNSLIQGRPIHVPKSQYLPFLSSLPAETRSRVLRADMRYMALVNTIAPKKE